MIKAAEGKQRLANLSLSLFKFHSCGDFIKGLRSIRKAADTPGIPITISGPERTAPVFF